jgi:hypothetical protein
MKRETIRRLGIRFPCPATLLNCLLGCALVYISGCGKGSAPGAGTDEQLKGPATVEQAARVLDLSTFAVMDAAMSVQRTVANLSYKVANNVKTAFEFQRKKLTEQRWKELPNTSITEQAASGTFARNGFIVSVSAYSNGKPGNTEVVLQNHGNINLGKLPLPSGVKPVYVGEATAMYVTDASVAATSDASRELFLAGGWQPYGTAGDSSYFKQNAIRLGVTVSSAPAQGGKTMISFVSELMSADLPVPPEAEELRYADETKELSFEIASNKDAVVDFYRKTLAKTGWEPTLDSTVKIDDKDEMIFRNPAKDMLTLSMPPARDGKISVSLQHQSAAEIAELDRQIKEHAPQIRAKIKAEQEEETARILEASKRLPKFAVTLPADASGVEQTKDRIKFNPGNGKAKAIVEAWRKEFQVAGWNENVATLNGMAGAASFSKGTQSLIINYTDTGVIPAEVSVSATGVELEPSSSAK